MNRRDFLTGMGVVLPIAGYASTQADSTSEQDSENGSSHEELRTATGFALQSTMDGISVEVTNKLTNIEATFTVGVVRGESKNHPPQIGGVFKNDSNQIKKFSFGSQAPLSPMGNQSPNSKIQLRTPPSTGEYKQDTCWRSQSDGWLSQMVVVKLAPGEMISNRLDVLSAPDTESCLPSGTYKFSQPVKYTQSGTGDRLDFDLTLV